ncbi:hypothetical protein JY96_12150 [Aquabacterium sp. NJ1]|uniref:PEP-CTERM sorting domain-containing protein n=1 Tax=Aquabacterium sp. NJ1 TaxID=1538295 RepID=UPI00052D2C91|nr:PEP-CTERM sorting domain-containing protein [Aquabacterium sp. NJ1]KGM40536.1 hypothetical protein JY96_12150 [Aquabacterium sp. NJ1]
MQFKIASKRLAVALALTVAGLAQAASFSNAVDVSLLAPGGTTDGVTLNATPLALQQSVSPSGQILPGDGTDIGGFMLPLESVTLSGTSILVSIAQGASNGTTGYLGAGGQHASYVFDNLNVAGSVITGVTYTPFDNFGASGFVGVSNLATLSSHNFIRLASSHSVVMDLDEIQFADRGQGDSNNFANFRINVQTAPVPEPAVSALVLAGLMALGLTRKLRQS